VSELQPNIPAEVMQIQSSFAPSWQDDFSDLSKWYQDTLERDNLHRTGNTGLEADGTLTEDQWQKVPGRWAARYDKHRDQCQFIRDNQLIMRGVAVEELNPLRDNFADSKGVIHRYGDYNLYAAWLSTWTRKFDNTLGRHVTDFDNSTLMIGPGSVVEVRVNFEHLKMRGHRWSFWLMPCTDELDNDPENPKRLNESASYDDDTENGVEIDIPEVEHPSRVNSDFGNIAHVKYVAGSAGDTPNGGVNMAEHGIDLRAGWHTFTCVRTLDGRTRLFCDGVLINHDDRPVLTYCYLILSREMNSGVKDPKGPYIPLDPGLSANSVILDVDLMDEDYVVVDYVRVWDVTDEQIVISDRAAKIKTLKSKLAEVTDLLSDLESIETSL